MAGGMPLTTEKPPGWADGKALASVLKLETWGQERVKKLARRVPHTSALRVGILTLLADHAPFSAEKAPGWPTLCDFCKGWAPLQLLLSTRPRADGSEYLHTNRVKRGLVRRPGEWV